MYSSSAAARLVDDAGGLVPDRRRVAVLALRRVHRLPGVELVCLYTVDVVQTAKGDCLEITSSSKH
jgi:hypothetical protein